MGFLKSAPTGQYCLCVGPECPTQSSGSSDAELHQTHWLGSSPLHTFTTQSWAGTSADSVQIFVHELYATFAPPNTSDAPAHDWALKGPLHRYTDHKSHFSNRFFYKCFSERNSFEESQKILNFFRFFPSLSWLHTSYAFQTSISMRRLHKALAG